MKIRMGFVSNSSSSSFIISTKNIDHTVDSVYEQLQQMFIEMYWKDENKKTLNKVKKSFRDCLYVFNVDKESDKKDLAKWVNSITCWGFEKEDMKNGIWIISNGDNAIPYAFIEKIQDTFNCEYHHLG